VANARPDQLTRTLTAIIVEWRGFLRSGWDDHRPCLELLATAPPLPLSRSQYPCHRWQHRHAHGRRHRRTGASDTATVDYEPAASRKCGPWPDAARASWCRGNPPTRRTSARAADNRGGYDLFVAK